MRIAPATGVYAGISKQTSGARSSRLRCADRLRADVCFAFVYVRDCFFACLLAGVLACLFVCLLASLFVRLLVWFVCLFVRVFVGIRSDTGNAVFSEPICQPARHTRISG